MRRLLKAANAALLATTLAMVLSVLVAYPWAESFSLGTQIVAHIGTLLFAVGIKISYVARLTALKALGLPVH